MRCIPLKTADQIALQALHRVRPRFLVKRTAVVNQMSARIGGTRRARAICTTSTISISRYRERLVTTAVPAPCAAESTMANVGRRYRHSLSQNCADRPQIGALLPRQRSTRRGTSCFDRSYCCSGQRHRIPACPRYVGVAGSFPQAVFRRQQIEFGQYQQTSQCLCAHDGWSERADLDDSHET